MADDICAFNIKKNTLGYKIAMLYLKNKKIKILIITILMTFAVILLYPIGNKLLLAVRGRSRSSRSSHVYTYSLPKKLVIEDTSTLPAAKAVPILMYHGVIGNGGEIGTNIDRKIFINQMEMLKRKGYKTVSVKEYDLFREGKFVLPPKPIIITFDDGRKDSFYTVDEILKKLNFKATIFIATIKADENDSFYLSWDELAKMQTTGRWEIEAHGQRSHDKIIIDENGTQGRYYTSRIYTPGTGLESIEEYKKRVEDDFKNGVADLKEHLGIDAKYFAVPFGNYGVREPFNYGDSYKFNEELTKRFFKLSFFEVDLVESFYNYKDSDPYKIIRLEVRPYWSANNLLKILDTTKEKDIPYFDNFSYYNGWIQTWGKMSLGDNTMTLNSSSSSEGSTVFLGGSQLWKNYVVKSDIDFLKGRTFSLLARYKDNKNYVACVFASTSLRVEQMIDGERKLIVEKKNNLGSIGKDKKVGIGVYGNSVICYANTKLVLESSNLESVPDHGGIGFEIWDPEVGNSEMVIKEVLVDEIKQ